MTNTAHSNCTHPATKQDRARCRRANGKAAAGTTVKPAGHRESHVRELCACRNVPAVDGVCPACDRPSRVAVMTQLGELLVAA